MEGYFFFFEKREEEGFFFCIKKRLKKECSCLHFFLYKKKSKKKRQNYSLFCIKKEKKKGRAFRAAHEPCQLQKWSATGMVREWHGAEYFEGFFFGSLVLFDRDKRRERREGERGVKINNFFSSFSTY